MQVCDAKSVNTLKGVVSENHIYMHLEYRPSRNRSSLVKKLEGRSSRCLQ